MTKEEEEIIAEKLTGQEIGEFLFFLTLMETMERHGYQCTYSKLEERLSFQEPLVHQKKLALTYVAHTEEKNTLFLISQELERLKKNFMKLSKKSKMDWFLTTDTQVTVEISKELK